MKKIFTLFSALFFAFSIQAQSVTVSVGPGYGNDVYYSLETGTVKTVDRSNWDIAFKTHAFSASIIANHAAGVELYTYPKGDTSTWSTLDTSGMIWNAMYNSIESWDEGAFMQNEQGHPDYGWGEYNMGNHHIVGDSLYVIKTVAGDYMKLWIEQKNAVTNIWNFKYAKLDGSNTQNITLDAGNYDTKTFVYYSLDSNLVQDREPAADTWDLLFTKYYDYTIPYSVTGVLAHEDVMLEEVSQSGLDQTTFNTYTEANFTSDIHTIGSDWKEYSFTAGGWALSDSTVFFIKTYNDNDDSIYYKLYFTAFGGSTTGDYTFMQEMLLHTDIENNLTANAVEVYPNPSSNEVMVLYTTAEKSQIRVTDVQGKIIMVNDIDVTGDVESSLTIDQLQPGMYFIQVISAEGTYTQKIVKQ